MSPGLRRRRSMLALALVSGLLLAGQQPDSVPGWSSEPRPAVGPDRLDGPVLQGGLARARPAAESVLVPGSSERAAFRGRRFEVDLPSAVPPDVTVGLDLRDADVHLPLVHLEHGIAHVPADVVARVGARIEAVRIDNARFDLAEPVVLSAVEGVRIDLSEAVMVVHAVDAVSGEALDECTYIQGVFWPRIDGVLQYPFASQVGRSQIPFRSGDGILLEPSAYFLVAPGHAPTPVSQGSCEGACTVRLPRAGTLEVDWADVPLRGDAELIARGIGTTESVAFSLQFGQTSLRAEHMPVGDYDLQLWDLTGPEERTLAASSRALVRWRELSTVRFPGAGAEVPTASLGCLVRVPPEWPWTNIRLSVEHDGPTRDDSAAWVTVERDPSSSEARLEVPGLRPGRYHLVAYPFIAARTVRVDPGRNEVVWDLPRPGRIRARIPGAFVGRIQCVSWLRDLIDCWHMSESDGFPADRAEHVVWVHPGGHLVSLFAPGIGTRHEHVEVRSGEEVSVSLAPYEEARFELSVEPRSALPKDEAVNVSFFRTESRRGELWSGRSVLNGVGSGEIEPGTYRVELEATRTSEAAVVTEVRLEAGATRRITIPVRAR